MSLRWSLYFAPIPLSTPKGVSETENGRFPSKIALRLKKVCYKVSLCENCQRHSCKAFIGLKPCKNDWWGPPLLRKNLVDDDLSVRIRAFDWCRPRWPWMTLIYPPDIRHIKIILPVSIWPIDAFCIDAPKLNFLASTVPEIWRGSQNFRRRSRDPFPTPFDLIWHFFRYYPWSVAYRRRG